MGGEGGRAAGGMPIKADGIIALLKGGGGGNPAPNPKLFNAIGGGNPPMGGNPGQGPCCGLSIGGKRSLENPGGGWDGSWAGAAPELGGGREATRGSACTRFRSRSSTLMPAFGSAGKGGMLDMLGMPMGGIGGKLGGGWQACIFGARPLACKSAMKSGFGPKKM